MAAYITALITTASSGTERGVARQLQIVYQVVHSDTKLYTERRKVKKIGTEMRRIENVHKYKKNRKSADEQNGRKHVK